MSSLIPSQFGEPNPGGTPLNLGLLQQHQHQLLLQGAPPLQQSMGVAGSPSQLPQPQQLMMNPVSQVKRRRSLPGNPDPDAEVIALSPKSLLATNRFVCEVCGKGFQRDQNLQLHRRGHNLPWKLKQKANLGDEAPRKKVYVCPEVTCVHHDPARALGDLTGIKKHFCRKHWEKKWKCERCSKKYAVQSDWKAHVKTCGTKEYRCGCGTLFSRRDSFITHRAFCDALSEETARSMTINPIAGTGGSLALHHHHLNHPFLQLHHPSPSSTHLQHHNHHDSIMSNLTSLQTAAVASSMQHPGHFPSSATAHSAMLQEFNLKRQQQQLQLSGMGQQGEVDENPTSGNWPLFCQPSATASPHHQTGSSSNHHQQLSSLDLPSSLFLPNRSLDHHLSSTNFQSPAPSPHMSATALLQRAAQIGATMSHQLEPSASNTAHLSPVVASMSSATAPSSSGFSLGLSSPHDTGGSSLTSFGHDFSSHSNQVANDIAVMVSMGAAHQSTGVTGSNSGFSSSAQFDVDGIGRMLGIKREDHHFKGLNAARREHFQMSGGGGGGGGSDGLTRDFLGLRGLYHRDIHGIVSMDPNAGAPTSLEQAQQQMKKHWS